LVYKRGVKTAFLSSMCNTKLLLPALAGILLTSCGQQFYRPRPSDPPLLSEAGQLHVNALVNVTAANGPTGSVAWSPVKHLGLQAGYNATRHSGNITSNGNSQDNMERRRNLFGGVGYYTHLKANTLFEIYGGAGAVSYHAENYGFVQSLKFTNYYVQPSIAWHIRDMDLAFSVRYDYLRRGETVVDSVHYAADYGGIHSFLNDDSYQLLQPGFTFRAGKKQVKFQVEISQSYLLKQDQHSLYGRTNQDGMVQVIVGLSVDPKALFH
jgi:hypothetical protein